MRNIFISGSAQEFTSPWTKEKAETFARKLAARMVLQDYRITSGFGLGIGSSVINGALDVIYSSKYKHIDEHLCLRPFPQGYTDLKEKEQRNALYRENMIEDIGIAIFIFGNKIGSDKVLLADGCKKEFDIAIEKGRIVIPVGSTGYMAQELLETVKKDIDNYPYLKTFVSDLETETDIDKLINIIMRIVDNQQLA